MRLAGPLRIAGTNATRSGKVTHGATVLRSSGIQDFAAALRVLDKVERCERRRGERPIPAISMAVGVS
jgi:hypothetical protein